MDSYNNKNNQNYDEFEPEEKGGSPLEKFSKENIMEAIKKPKNIIIILIVVTFIIVVVAKLTSSPTKEVPKVEEPVTNQKLPDVIDFTKIEQPRNPQPTVQPAPEVAAPALPPLDISLFEKLEAANKPAPQQQDAEDELNDVDVEALRKQLEEENAQEVPFEEVIAQEPIIKKRRKSNPDAPPPPILDFINGQGPIDKTSRKNLSDFLFIDSSMDSEISDEVPNEGKLIANLGNIIAQGRMIDAVLETAINSSIPGTIRAVVSRDVYAEAGRSILIPKGTRLYGAYSSGAAITGRLIITWSRIFRPDGISLGINSFASDQFGRAGVQGDIDKKYGEIIASALLLSSIPLIATIATQQITGDQGSTTTTTVPGVNGVGITTTQSNAISRATERFSDQVSQATQQVVTGLIDTSTVITIPQGTRIKVMVNQDIKLPRYKPLTSLNTTVTNSSQ